MEQLWEPAPSYANLFMGKFEQQAIDNFLLKPFIWWRFIYDIFMIWTHGEEHLKNFHRPPELYSP